MMMPNEQEQLSSRCVNLNTVYETAHENWKMGLMSYCLAGYEVITFPHALATAATAYAGRDAERRQQSLSNAHTNRQLLLFTRNCCDGVAKQRC